MPVFLEVDIVDTTTHTGTQGHTATLKNGMVITTPPHIKVGERVVLRTDDWTYSKKA